jgi:hypothetical protein
MYNMIYLIYIAKELIKIVTIKAKQNLNKRKES